MPWFEVGIGGLLNSMEMELNVNRKIFEGPENVKRENSQKWLNHMLIASV
jgi:hypothetical protein